MQNYFNDLAKYIETLLIDGENYLLYLKGEESDFVRFNNAKIRQNGSVSQMYIWLTLIVGQRNLKYSLTLSLNRDEDKQLLKNTVDKLRKEIKSLDEDPYLIYSTEVNNTHSVVESNNWNTMEIANEIATTSSGKDLVGILANGKLVNGFANSFGQRNWFEQSNFNFDWSVYHKEDKAVKNSYAGIKWDSDTFSNKMYSVMEQLEIMAKPSMSLKPGKYRVFLTPSALSDFMKILSWMGFGIKNQKTKNSSLIQLAEKEKRFHDSVNIMENAKEGVAPQFNELGFIIPDNVSLIKNGELDQFLVSPRSAKEYDVEHNGANGGEFPMALELAGGNIKNEEVLSNLGTGLYINNTHYLNYSDRPACRITGMTRYACFWVENGRIEAPINVMRFDESLYRMLGENLIGLTSERDFIISNYTYEARHVDSIRLPGALINDFAFTL